MEVRPGEILQLFGLFIAAVGLFLNWWQLRKNGLQRRAEQIMGLFAKYQDDPETVEMFRRVDHGEEIFNDRFHGTADESKLDKLLFAFERIAYLHELGIVSVKDLQFVTYEFIRIKENRSVQDYFAWLDNWYAQNRIAKQSFGALRRVALKLEQTCGGKARRRPFLILRLRTVRFGGLNFSWPRYS